METNSAVLFLHIFVRGEKKKMKLSVYLKIGTKMKNLRKEKGISQKKMAERLNLIPSAYSNYENLICEIPVEVMQKFCEEVECSMEELIEFDIGNLDEVHPVSSLSDLILSIMELNKKDLPVSVTFHMEKKNECGFSSNRDEV